MTNSSGGVVAEQSFDAWGRYRDVNTWVATTTAPAGGVWTWLTRGYTSHEHLRPFALINMNGRLYDPALGRVLSSDNYIQDPFFTQNYNRYSYAYNNPMVYNDPDGQWLNFVIGAALGGFSGWKIGQAQGATGWGMLGYIYAGAAIGTLTAGLGSSIVASFSYAAQSGVSMGGAILAYGTAGAASGLVGGASFAFLSGGNVWEGMWKGALFGGIGGASGGYLKNLAFDKSIHDINNYLAGEDTYFGGTLNTVIVRASKTVALPAPSRTLSPGVLLGLSRVSSFLSFASLFEGDVSHTQKKQPYTLMYRNMGESEYHSFIKKGGDFGYGVNTLDNSKQFWMTPEGLAAWNAKSLVAGPYNVIIRVPKSIISPYGLVQQQILDGHLAGTVKPGNMNLFNKAKIVISVTKR